MRPVRVTVLLSVVDGASHLSEAIQSILRQTFDEFELVVLDRVASGGTAEIVRSFTDPRIRYVADLGRGGLAATLNREIERAQGQYLARMDANDLSLPTRLEQQVRYLDAHAACALVATRVTLIDANGQRSGLWREDQRAITSAQIREALLRSNCLAHSSVMLRTAVAKRHHYDPKQRHGQEYDLWLRLASEGYELAKLDEPLLLLRRAGRSGLEDDHEDRDLEMREIEVKLRYLHSRLAARQLNRYDLRLLSLLAEQALRHPRVVQAIKRTLRPLSIGLGHLGRFVGEHWPRRKAGAPLFFLFPDWEVSGAGKVHLDILSCFVEDRPRIYFTVGIPVEGYRRAFDERGETRDIGRWACLFPVNDFVAGALAGYINRHPSAVLFGGVSLFFYRVLPYLAEHVRAIDLIHAFGGGYEHHTVEHIPRIDFRVTNNEKTVEKFSAQYRALGIPAQYLQRVHVMPNWIEIPERCPPKTVPTPLRVLFVGRGADEKRVHLVGRIARRCHEQGLDATFTLVGNVVDYVDPLDRSFCRLAGEVVEREMVARYYDEAHVLLLTSSREGSPVVIQEAMARGVVPIATDVGGVAEQVHHEQNGILLPAGPEATIVERGVFALARLAAEPARLASLAAAGYAHARQSFGATAFRQAYRDLVWCTPSLRRIPPEPPAGMR